MAEREREVDLLAELDDAECQCPDGESEPATVHRCPMHAGLEIDRLRARTHEIQAEEMAKRAELDAEVAQWRQRYAAAKQWTEDAGLRAEWAVDPTSPFWLMTSYNARSALMRLVADRDTARAEVDRLTAERDEARQYRDLLLQARANVDRALDAALDGVSPELVEAAASEGGQAGVITLLVAERDRAIAAELRRLAGALDTARREAWQDSHDPVSAGKARGYSGAIAVLTARAAALDPDAAAVTRVADAIADVVTAGREVLDKSDGGA